MRKPPVSTKPRSRTQVNGSVSPLGNKGGSPAAGRNTRPKPQADDVPHLDDEEAAEVDAHEDEFESAEIEGDAAIDDPVRMYLMQMGEIPMLNRDNEVAAAMQIESTRRRFRRTMLCSDFMLHAAVDLLQKVADGTLRLDRTIEISVTNTTEKKRILKRIAPNLATARELLGLNQNDYRRAVSRRTTVAEKHRCWRRMIARRNKVDSPRRGAEPPHSAPHAADVAAARNQRADVVDQVAARRRASNRSITPTSTNFATSFAT